MEKTEQRFPAHRLALVVVWIGVTAAVSLMLFQGVRGTDRYWVVLHLLHASYVVVLLWFLARTGPAMDRLPEIEAQILPRWRHGAVLPVVGIALMLFVQVVSDDGLDLLLLLLMLATVWILVAWRREVRIRAVLQGVAVAVIAYLAVLPAAENGLIGQSALILLVALSAPMYVAGGLLIARTRLGGAQLLAERYREAGCSVLRGCLLFVPLGLTNAADGSPGTEITWVTEWWMPFTLPWFSSIAEEILFRLFLVGLCYFLLRPALRGHPGPAIVAAVIFSSVTFGLGHGGELETFLTTGLLYGVPMAVVFARRDWEHAVGAHYMINMIPWLMVFLES